MLVYESSSRAAELALLHAPAAEPSGAEPGEFSLNKEVVEQMIDHLAAISPVEADIVELRLRGCREVDLAIVLGLSQSSIAYRYARAMRRLAYLRWLDGIRLDVETIQVTLEPLVDRLLVDVVITTWATFEPSYRVAELVGITEGQMRYFWFRACGVVEKAAGSTGASDALRELHRWMSGHRWRTVAEESPTPRKEFGEAVLEEARDAVLHALRKGARSIRQLARICSTITAAAGHGSSRTPGERLLKTVLVELEGSGLVWTNRHGRYSMNSQRT